MTTGRCQPDFDILYIRLHLYAHYHDSSPQGDNDFELCHFQAVDSIYDS